MNNLRLLLLLSLFTIRSATAQNWDLVMPNDTLVYEKQVNHQFFTLWVDSTFVSGTDTTYFMNRISPGDSVSSTNQTNVCTNPNIWQPSYTLYALSKPQFCGASIEKSNNKWTIIFPQKGLVIYPNNPVNSSWIYDSITMDSIIVTSTDTAFLQGYQVLDSIKTFSATGFSLTLSKHHGIIEITDLESISTAYNLIGVQNLDLGETIPMGTDHFDYEVGDVFFRREAFGDSDYFTSRRYMSTILSKSYSGDTLIYSVKSHIRSSYYSDQSSSDTYKDTTISTANLKYWPDMHPFLNAYPNTLEFSNDFFCDSYPYYNDSLPKNVLIYRSSDHRITRSNAKSIYLNSLPNYGNYSFCTVDSADLYAEVQSFTAPMTLKTGLGVIQDGFSGLYSCEYELLGYKKMDGTSWGDTNYISSVNHVKFSNNIHIYPNPAKNFITIETEKTNGTSVVELYDLQGRLTAQQPFKNTIQLDVSSFSAGVYFIVIKDENEAVLHREKVVIQ